MQIEFLGTGGAITTPRPGCFCHVCKKAREQGVPYSRLGPSVFVHGPDVLIDTPEEIVPQLNRSRVKQIAACFYSHWHPDHTMGRRVWEMNFDWQNWPPQHTCTDVFLPQQVALDARTRLGMWEHFGYLQKIGMIRLVEMADGDVVTLDNVHIRPFRLAEDYVYAFMFEGDGKRVLIAPDELFKWDPPAEVQGIDLAIIPMGLAEFHPLTNERRIHEDHFILKVEATFRQTLDIVRKLQASHTIMTHIEEVDSLTPDEFNTLEKRLRSEGFNITFAYDTMLHDV